MMNVIPRRSDAIDAALQECVARGGSEARHARAQLERAHAFLAARQPAPPIRLLVVHTGGNDVVHSLPFAFPLLVVDLVRLALIRAGVLARLERPPSSFSFVGLTSRRIARDTRALLEPVVREIGGEKSKTPIDLRAC